MAGANRKTTNPLNVLEELEKEPYRFNFFQALRLLECCFKDKPKTGYSTSPKNDPVRFGQKPFLNFAPSTLEGLEYSRKLGLPLLFVRFLGLFGPNSPLPLHLTEFILEREMRNKDFTLRGFANLFHHRLISFFYRAWADCRKAPDMDRETDQRFATFIGCLMGLGLDSLRDQDQVSDLSKLYFSGLLACPTRHAEGLEAILRDYFDIPSIVIDFAGRWITLPPYSSCRLGESPGTGQLGVNAIVGERMWDCQLSFRVRMGPMSLADFKRMLPHGDSFPRLKSWIQFYSGEQYFWDVNLVLKKEEVPVIALGQEGSLGWTTWLKSREFRQDADDLILNPPN